METCLQAVPSLEAAWWCQHLAILVTRWRPQVRRSWIIFYPGEWDDEIPWYPECRSFCHSDFSFSMKGQKAVRIKEQRQGACLRESNGRNWEDNSRQDRGQRWRAPLVLSERKPVCCPVVEERNSRCLLLRVSARNPSVPWVLCWSPISWPLLSN